MIEDEMALGGLHTLHVEAHASQALHASLSPPALSQEWS